MHRVSERWGPFTLLLTLLALVSAVALALPGPAVAASAPARVVAAGPPGTVWQPEPTVARLGANLKLTLTFATRVTDAAGNPKVGVPIHFSLLGPIPGFYEEQSPRGIEICDAVTNANGFATCKGKAFLASIVSLVTGGAYATEYLGFFPTEENTKLPVFTFG